MSTHTDRLRRAPFSFIAVGGLFACRDKAEDSAPRAADTSDTSETSGEGTDTGEFVNPCAEGSIHIDDDPTAYPSIQAALNNVVNGSVVYVCPGTHYESIKLPWLNKVFNERDSVISIVGTSSEDTIIDADSNGPVFLMGEATIELSDLTLKGGSGSISIIDGDSYTFGGAIYNIHADVSLQRVVVEQNSTSIGGGLYVGGHTWSPLIVLTDCIIRNNIADGGADTEGKKELYGGAAYLFNMFRLESYNTDWGEGGDDNEPNDIAYKLPTHNGIGIFDAGAAASFVCDSEDEEEPCQVLK